MITQAEMPLERMQRAVKGGCTCSECGALLTLAYGGKWGILQDVLMCPGNPEHKGMAREAALSALDTPDEYNPFSYTLDRVRRKRLVSQLGEERAQALERYSGRTNLTPVEAREIIMACFPGAPEIEVKKAVWICVQKRLNPLMKHLFLVSYNNKQGGKDWAIIMAIKSERIRAMRAGGVSYLDDSPRLMTEAEQMKIRGPLDPVNDWYICKGRNSRGQEASGYGCWPKNLAPKGTDKGNTGSNMGMIRAERQMIDRLCPDEADEDVGVTDGQYAAVGNRIIEIQTGEIVEGSKGPELPDGHPSGQGAEPAMTEPQTEAKASQGPFYGVTEDKVKTRGDLFTMANKHLELDRTAVLKKLGLADADAMIEKPWHYWQKLTAPAA